MRYALIAIVLCALLFVPAAAAASSTMIDGEPAVAALDAPADVSMTVEAAEATINMLIYNPNSPGPDGSVCRGDYGKLPYQYLTDNGFSYTYWCNSNVVDAAVLAEYDVLYLGRSR